MDDARARSARSTVYAILFCVTYEPGRRTRGGAGQPRRDPEAGRARVPVLRDEWREPLRAQRDPLSEDGGRPRSNRDERRRWRKQTWLGRFLSTYGWRAYALPALVALTVWVVYSTVTGTSTPDAENAVGPAQGPPTLGASSTSIVGAPPKGLTQFDANLPTGILPDGGPYTEAGAKTWHIVPGTDPKVGEGTTKTFTYTVEVEDGVDTTAFGGDDNFARMVSQTLGNPKSWTHNPQFAFTRVDSGDVGFPGVADQPDDIARGLRVRDSDRDVLLQPELRTRRPAAGCSSTKPAGSAARCPSRAMSAPTANT